MTTLGVLFTGNLCGAFSAEASWFIDARKFHISAHGQLSCLDCHGDIVKKDFHPDPGEVTKDLKDFFRVEQCARCHRDVIERIDKGFHKRVIAHREEFLQCIRCHDPHYQPRSGDPADPFKPSTSHLSARDVGPELLETLPPAPPEVETCVSCHRSIEFGDPKESEKVSWFCFHCHAENVKNPQLIAHGVPLIDVPEYQQSPHAAVSCLTCHPHAAQYNHADQISADCGQCHLPHDEKIAHDAHMIVSCESCHLAGIIPLREPASKRIRWQTNRKAGSTSAIHSMISSSDEALCRRCHFSSNQVGAASQLLPAKSIICMPCHAATFSWADTVTIITLVCFVLGLLTVASVWFSGTRAEGLGTTAIPSIGPPFKVASKKLLSFPLPLLLKGFIFDVFFQMRLFRLSKTRWVIHGLIFFPFVFRFSWGLLGLVGSLWKPEWPTAWTMLNKNHPVTGLLFDVTGIMMGLGVLFAFLRERRGRTGRIAGLPRPDTAALGLLAAIVLVGFVVEGVRIAMTATPSNAEYAFVGYALSRLFSGSVGLPAIYGPIWYLHAMLAGALLVYLPFSRLLHIIMAPVVLMLNASSNSNREMKKRH